MMAGNNANTMTARMGYEDADATRKQGEYAQHGDPMRDADDQETTWRLLGLT